MKMLRSMELANDINHGNRTLEQSSLSPEVVQALRDWKLATITGAILIGGLALSFYVKPRYTQDLDFLFLSADDTPSQIPGFRRTRGHAFQHNGTHVEVEILDPDYLKQSRALVERVVATAHDVDGLKVASPEGLVALKLKRFSRQDQADIESLKALPTFAWDAEWDAVLTDEQRARFASI